MTAVKIRMLRRHQWGEHEAVSLTYDVFLVDPKPIPSAVAQLARVSTSRELIDRMTAAYPDFANPYTLWVAAYDVLGASS